MNRFVLRQSLLLLLAAFIWGVAFVAQSVGMDYVEPLTFNAVRSLLGAATLLPVIIFFGVRRSDRRAAESGDNLPDGPAAGRTGSESNAADGAAAGLTGSGNIAAGRTGSESIVPDALAARWTGAGGQLLIAGVFCGVLLCIATNFQQIGIMYTTVGKSGFITAMYIVIVPLLGLFVGKKAGVRVWAAVVLAAFGLYYLCMSGGTFSFEQGDLLTLMCAVTFSFHILTVDYFAPRVDGVKLSCIQFFVCGVLSGIGSILFETPQLSQILAAWLPILYAGVLSCGVAYTLQIVGQRGMNPTVASLLLCMESVVSVIAGFVLLGQRLSARELCGCGMMLSAIILVQLPGRRKNLKKETDKSNDFV